MAAVSAPSSKSYCASSRLRLAPSRKAAICVATSTAVWPPSVRVRIVTGGFIERLAAAEIGAGVPFARELAARRRVVAVGRVAQEAFGGTYVRHPAHGGGAAFRRGLEQLLS